MSNWRHTTIGALGRVVTGKTPQTSHPEYYGGDIPFITPSDMEQRYALDVSRKLSDAGARSVKNCILPAYSVAVSCIGSDMGKSVMTDRPSVTNQQLNAIIVNNENDPHFVYYLTSSMRAIFKLNAQGSTALPILNKGHFANIKVQVPDLPTQKMLAGALSALDSKIEHNNELIKMLEEQAQLVYNYWFMQFDFPDENGKPYRSSGGKMVWNDKLKREIPEGWKIAGIDRFLTLTRGVSYKPTDASDIPTPMHTCILRANNIDFGTIRWDGLVYVKTECVNQKTQRLKENDIVIVMSSGSKEHVGKTATAWGDLDCSYGAFCAKITPHEQCTSYVRTSLRSSTFRAFLKKQLLATNINNISLSVLANYIVPEPTYNVLERFQQITGEIYTRCNTLHAEIYELTKQRDFLLPLLMSGLVTVAE